MATVKQIHDVAMAGARNITARKRVRVEVGHRWTVKPGTDVEADGTNLIRLARDTGQTVDEAFENGDLYETVPLKELKSADFSEPGEFDLYVYTWSGQWGYELDTNIALHVDGDQVTAKNGDIVLAELRGGKSW